MFGSAAASAQAVVQSGQAAPGHIACWAGAGGIMDCGAGSGNYIVTFPAPNSVVISNGTTSPSGILPSTNGCLTSAGGAWSIGACGTGGGGGISSITAGTGLSGGTITSAGTIAFAATPANTLLGSLSATTPSALAVPSCVGGSNALTWQLGVGFGCNTINAGGTVTSIATGSGLSGGTITTAGTIALATQSANTIMASLTASIPTGITVPSCSSAGSALNWTLGAGFGCVNTGSGGNGTVSSVTAGTGLSGGTITTAGTIALAALSANTVLGALTATAPTGLTMPSCSSSTSALIWTSGTGFGCNILSASGTVTSITTGSGLSGGTITTSGSIALATQSANTIMASLTAAPPTGITVPTCSAANQALNWTAGGGFGCVTIVGGSGGGVSSVSVATGNGFSGSVANATTTPTISLGTTITGLTKGLSGGLVAATAGVDYVLPTGSGAGLTGLLYTQLPGLSANQILGSLTSTTPAGISVPSCSGGSSALTWTLGSGFGCNTIGAGGTVTSITAGSGLAGGTITTVGTLALATQSANTIMASLTSAAPTGIAVPGCAGANQALTWTTGTGFGCVTISSSGSAGTAVVQDFVAGTNFTPGSTSTLTLSSTPSAAAAVMISFDGIHQAANTWGLSGAVLNFNAAIPLNVQVVEAQWVQSSGSGGGGVTAITAGTGLSGGTITASGTIALAPVTSNTVLGAISSTAPGPLTMPSCSTSSSALTWTTNTGFGCNSISGGGGGALTVGTTTIANGVNGSLLYNNSGILGNETLASILTSPPAIGAVSPATGSFTALSATSTTGAAFSNFLASTGTGLLTQPVGGGWYWDSGMVVYNTTESTEPWEYTAGTITSVTYFTAGTTPTFTVGWYINGTPITGCTGIIVTSATPASTTCTGANVISKGQYLTEVITASGGTPQSAGTFYAGTRTNY